MVCVSLAHVIPPQWRRVALLFTTKSIGRTYGEFITKRV